MSISEKRIEQEIGWYKIVFAILFTAEISLLAWLARHYSTSDALLLSISLLVAVLISLAIILINKKVFDLLNSLNNKEK